MSRPILSRPRTRVYGCNYDKGESYYKPMVDHLDRKYSPRPLFSDPRTSFADEIAARRSDFGTRDLAGSARHDALGLGDFELPRKLSPLNEALFPEDAEDTVYDSRGQRTSRRRLGEDFASEVAATTRRLKARVTAIDEEFARSALEGADAAFKRRPKFLLEEQPVGEKPNLTKWSKLADSPETPEDLGSSAATRALRSKARLSELMSEMDDISEKQARREKRVAALKALASEAADETLLSSQTSKTSLRSEKHVAF